MQENHQMYTSREDVEQLLQQTLESTDKQDKKTNKGSKKKATPGMIVRRVIYGVLLVSLLFMLGKVWLAKLTGNVARALWIPDVCGGNGQHDPDAAYRLHHCRTGAS